MAGRVDSFNDNGYRICKSTEHLSSWGCRSACNGDGVICKARAADDVMAAGTIDQTRVYLREILKESLCHESSALTLVQNHLIGNPKPLNIDIDFDNADYKHVRNY